MKYLVYATPRNKENTMGIGQDLLDMKSDIEKAKTKKAQAEGALKNIQATLLDEYGLKSYDDACDYVTVLEADCKKYELSLKEAMAELRENFDV